MGVEVHKELLSNIGLDVKKHAKMMSAGFEAYKKRNIKRFSYFKIQVC